MALYTRDSIERAQEAVDMVQVVGAKTDLRRVGSRWVGLCPFHDERTPSFSVDPEQRLYYCFGCGAGGDAIGFESAFAPLWPRCSAVATAMPSGWWPYLATSRPKGWACTRSHSSIWPSR
jgi:CHC2 zinc finger